MFLQEFHNSDRNLISISTSQASRFAKEVAGDYNPIHDIDAKRFCVPGDLIFALVLARYGLYQKMEFNFCGMVGAGVNLVFPPATTDAFDIADEAGKVYLKVTRAGKVMHDAPVIEAFIRTYVAFSGKNFPGYLQPLLASKNVMFNPDRPLVIYDRMEFELRNFTSEQPSMALTDSSLEVTERRGDAVLYFNIAAQNEIFGKGSKNLIISGLREYDEDRMQKVMNDYNRRKESGFGDGV